MNTTSITVDLTSKVPAFTQESIRTAYRRGWACMEQCSSSDEATALYNTLSYESDAFLEGAQDCINHIKANRG